jgi:hypothetical protein
MSTTKEDKISKKISVDIFVPLNQCACVYESYIQRVFSVLFEYLDYISFQTKSLDSDEARNLGLTENCVVLDGEKIVTTSFTLKREIPKMLKEKNMQKTKIS